MRFIFRAFYLGVSALLLSVFSAANASADTVEDARRAFNIGQYDAALTLLERREDTPSLTLKAEILSAQIMLGLPRNLHKTAIAARQAAEKALKKSPQDTEATIQLALASGFETRTASIFKAWRKQLPQSCFDAIAAAYKAAPSDARPQALLGAWHLGIVRKAGPRRAMSMFSASETTGIDWYDKALRTAPDDVVILGNYAFALLSIDPDRHYDAAKVLAQRTLAAPPRNAVDRQVQQRMAKVVMLMDDPEMLSGQIDRLMNDAG